MDSAHRLRCVCATQTKQHMISGDLASVTPLRALQTTTGGIAAKPFYDARGPCRHPARVLRVSIDSVLR
jgi:hypothetical protein